MTHAPTLKQLDELSEEEQVHEAMILLMQAN
jgi:hypothetical protein